MTESEAKTIREELDSLVKRGKLADTAVVAFARNPKTALHSHFCWDDTKAARLYRLVQAQAIIRMQFTVLPGPNQEPVRVRAFLAPESERGEGIYRRVEDVLSNADLLQEEETRLRRELEGVMRQSRALAKLSPLYQKVAKVLEEVPVS